MTLDVSCFISVCVCVFHVCFSLSVFLLCVILCFFCVVFSVCFLSLGVFSVLLSLCFVCVCVCMLFSLCFLSVGNFISLSLSLCVFGVISPCFHVAVFIVFGISGVFITDCISVSG